MDGAQLVAIRVSHIGQVQRAQAAGAWARRVLDRHASVRHGHIMEALHLLRRMALEANGAAVGHRGRLSVDGLGQAEGAALMAVEQAHMARARHISHGLTGTEYAQHRVVKALGALDVVGAEHDVIEHGGTFQ
jgi:hypothetical protein